MNVTLPLIIFEPVPFCMQAIKSLSQLLVLYSSRGRHDGFNLHTFIRTLGQISETFHLVLVVLTVEQLK